MEKGSSALYRGSFPAGFRPLVDRLLSRDFGDRSVLSGDESAIVFRAPYPLKGPAYLQTLALVVDETDASSIEEAYRRFADSAAKGHAAAALNRAALSPPYAGNRPLRFALRGFARGEPASVRKDARAALEGTIARTTGLKPDSQRPDLQLQVSLRDDGSAQFLASSRGARADDRNRGALPPATARLLCELSLPEDTDVFLDPFMGSGAIPLERARMGSYSMIFAGDSEPLKVEAFKEELAAASRRSPGFERKRRTIFPKLLDARDLSRFDPAFLTAVATDPPWGLYDGTGTGELLELYAAFLREADRTLARDGRLALLLGRDSPLEAAVRASGAGWRVAEDYAVLVSGRKARAVRLTRD